MANRERPARDALRQWLAAPGRSQVVLAAAVGVAQQTISRLLDKQDPSRELANLLELATGIPWRGWFTQRQLLRWERREAVARELGARASRAAQPIPG